MNEAKFEHYILKQTNKVEHMIWELLDEMATHVTDHFLEDKDQGPSKEWGPYGWYHHAKKERILKAEGENMVVT